MLLSGVSIAGLAYALYMGWIARLLFILGCALVGVGCQVIRYTRQKQ
jgi:hypothetical protein